jgi:hypothetical protein
MGPVLRAQDAILRTGVRVYHFTVDRKELVDGIQIKPAFLESVGEWFMVLSVAKEHGRFITIRPRQPHRSGAEARRYVGDVLKVPSGALQNRDFVVVKLSGLANLDVHVSVDTDNPTLPALLEKSRQAAAKPGVGAQAAGLQVPFTIDVFAIEPETRTVVSSHIEGRISLSPLRDMHLFDGYSALDFGNTSTTLVRSRMDEDAFHVIQADVVDRRVDAPAPVQTALRIHAIRPAEKPDQFNAYRCSIGEKALEHAESGWLSLGAKRLLADRRRSDADGGVIEIDNAVHMIPNEDPAELFIAQMLRGFFYHEQAVPEPIVVTCPTTFTVSEVSRLRRTVARAFHRATGKAAATFRPALVEHRVPIVVDEASAAAFYFVYRDFISGPGRMPGFRYLYPNGMHMLLYDCGGGTTDLSLVRLEAPDDQHLKISVLGRAGHRTFGGDFITEQLYRLLKMKLAIALGMPESPPTPGKLEEFLKKHERRINELVPTTFDPRHMQNDEARLREKTALTLWRLADKMKVRLGASGAKEVIPGDANVEEAREEGELLTTLHDVVGFDFLNRQEDLSISRGELDVLIDPAIDRTIEYANDLIEACMARRAAEQRAESSTVLEEPEVHWVYVVGNASRYPRIRQRLLDEQQGLRVRFLKERLAEVRPEDFKNSVAKGAVVAMKMRRVGMGMAVSWDQELMKKLPFDIVHETLGKASDQVLFATGEAYSSSLRRTIDIRPDPLSGRATTREIVLSRRWPGEAKSLKFLVFRFDEPIKGRYVIEYDEAETQSFIAYPQRDGGREEQVVAEPFEVPSYVAPPQSGRI